MRGYLQRLALGVMRPERTIHPMVGSVFSPQHQPEMSEALPRESSIFASSQPRSDAKHSQEEGERRFFTGEQKSGAASEAMEPNRLRAPEPIYTPLIPNVEAIQGKQTEDFPRPAEKISSSHPGEKSTLEALPERNAHPGEQTKELVVTHVYAPKVSESTVHSTLKAPAQKMDPFAATPRRAPRENSSRRSATPSGQPDEIQIHIGRIEVTAVQQAPVPPAVKPTRKGLSLDEYLQRANRRVR